MFSLAVCDVIRLCFDLRLVQEAREPASHQPLDLPSDSDDFGFFHFHEMFTDARHAAASAARTAQASASVSAGDENKENEAAVAHRAALLQERRSRLCASALSSGASWAMVAITT